MENVHEVRVDPRMTALRAEAFKHKASVLTTTISKSMLPALRHVVKVTAQKTTFNLICIESEQTGSR